MAKAVFNGISISAITTTVGNKLVNISDEMDLYGLDEKSLFRLRKTIGLNQRYVADDSICTSDLCVQSAEKIFGNYDVDKSEIEAIILVTQSPDYRAPSSSIIIQDRLGLSKSTLAFDVNLGCSGFVYGLFNAYCMINSGLKKVLLLVGDVNHYFTKKDKSFTPLMGDAGSAILVEKNLDADDAFFILNSDGSGYKNLIIPEGGARKPITKESFIYKNEDNCLRRGIDLYMNGAEVFNFAVNVVPDLLNDLFDYGNFSKEEIDYFILHQANSYILNNISNTLELSEDKLPTRSVEFFGNQNSASIPGTINGFLYDKFSNQKLKNVFAGFGIGLSWAACKINTNCIYAPKFEIYKKND